jgi:CTP:molybdopterin cytidylyltransferase MocA
MPTSSPCTGILLAAGKGSRMGMPKALLQWQGQTFLEHILQAQLNAGISHFLIVTQPSLPALIQEQSTHFSPHTGWHFPDIAHQPTVEWVEGDPEADQLHSLQRALAHLEQTGHHSRDLLVGPIDQGPYTSEIPVALLRETSVTNDRVWIPEYEHQTGHPVRIEAGFVKNLDNGHPQGLRGIFAEHPQQIQRVPLPYPAILRNLNTRDHLATFLQQHASIPNNLSS